MGLKIDAQLKHNDCGISAVKTVLNILDIDISRKYVEDSIFLDAEGSRLSDLKDFFIKNGLKAEYRLFDLSYVSKTDKTYYEQISPFILPIKSRDGIHFVVVNGMKNSKFRILNPSENKPYYLSASEIKKIAHYNNSYVDYVSYKEKYGALCNQILAGYELDIPAIQAAIPFEILFNKITYFLYVKDEYGLKDSTAEKNFLSDILFNQEISQLPKHFKIVWKQEERLRIKAPVILTVASGTDKQKQVFSQPDPDKKENVYLTLFKQLGQFKKSWYIYLLAAIFSASITQLSVFINQFLIDDVLPKKDISLIILFAIGVGLFKLFDLFIYLYKSWLGIHVGRLLDEFFLTIFDNKLNRFSLAYIHEYKRGDLTERLSDSMKLKAFFLRFFTRILVDTVVSVYSLGILLYINWQLTIVVVVVMILFYVWFRFITPYLQQNERLRFIKKADFFSKMIEKLEGIQVLKSTHTEELYSVKVRKSIQDLLGIQIKAQKINLANMAVSSSITIIASVVIILYLSRESIVVGMITVGQIITFIALTQRIFSSLGGILDENLTLQENQVILKRYLDFNEPQKIIEEGGIRDFSLDRIQIQGLAFEYYPGEPVLKDISMDIKKGNKIKIEGQNGSGKSTLSKVLALLYPSTGGTIIINDTDSKFYDQQRLKDKILLVTNEDILFNDTLLFNLTFGKEISTEQILSLAKELQIYDFISSKDQGLGFIISENGKNLSTGQRKKILLLRALLLDTELIILDEVLSGIDDESRKQIESCLNKIKEKTLIMISHEPVQTLRFDQVYRIVNGQLRKSFYS